MKKFVRAATTSLILLMFLFTMMGGHLAMASTLPFDDVPENHPYYNEIMFVYEEGIMNGTDIHLFSPLESLTRGQLVTILYRLSGSTEQIDPSFDDVAEGRFFYYPIGWAQYHGIVNGITMTEFCPDDTVTREQFMTIIYRYATLYEGRSYYVPQAELYTQWVDASDLSNFSKTAVNWAINCGILSCASNFRFYPGSALVRGECANYLYWFLHTAYGNSRVLADSYFNVMGVVPGEELNETINQSMRGNYESYLYINPQYPVVEYAFYNSEIIFVNAHGSAVSLGLYPVTNGSRSGLYVSDIDRGAMSGVELAYISSCKAGNDFCERLYSYGQAEQVVGFTETIYVSIHHLNQGLHGFNTLFFDYYFDQYYDAEDAGWFALDDMEMSNLDPMGCESFICYS